MPRQSKKKWGTAPAPMTHGHARSSQSRFDAKMCEREDDTAVKFSESAPKMPIFVNERARDGRNKWGSLRGYRMMPTRVMHNLLPENEGYGAGLGARRLRAGRVSHAGVLLQRGVRRILGPHVLESGTPL